MDVNRRDFLRTSGVLAAGAALPLACRTFPRAAAPPPFLHGVASGDPLQERVVLWTRVSAAPGTQRIPVRWEIAEDAGLRRIVARGTATTGPQRDFTLKVDATGLAPGQTYYYRFNALGEASAIARTRTRSRAITRDRVRSCVIACARVRSRVIARARACSRTTACDRARSRVLACASACSRVIACDRV